MKWILGLLCLFFLIIFHELGHFLAAKIFGVKVESFSVGFGTVIFHKMIGGTDFRLSLFPLGGYCTMKGEKDFSSAIEKNLPYIQAEKDSLYGIHPLKRAIIGFSGPFFNFIFAILAFSIISMAGYTYQTYSNKISIYSDEKNNITSPAKAAGLKDGDIIIKINEKDIEDFSEIISEVSIRADEVINVTVNRNGEILNFKILTQMDKSTGSGRIGVSADPDSLVKKEMEGQNFFRALANGFLESSETVLLTFKGIGLLFKGVDIKNAVSGPVRVTEMLGTTVTSGFDLGVRNGIASIFSLMGVISISLFIMNLLPVPVLDGGLILFALIEAIFRKKINPKIMYYTQFIGLFFIGILFVIGFGGDILYLLTKK